MVWEIGFPERSSNTLGSAAPGVIDAMLSTGKGIKMFSNEFLSRVGLNAMRERLQIRVGKE